MTSRWLKLPAIISAMARELKKCSQLLTSASAGWYHTAAIRQENPLGSVTKDKKARAWRQVAIVASSIMTLFIVGANILKTWLIGLHVALLKSLHFLFFLLNCWYYKQITIQKMGYFCPVLLWWSNFTIENGVRSRLWFF